MLWYEMGRYQKHPDGCLWPWVLSLSEKFFGNKGDGPVAPEPCGTASTLCRLRKMHAQPESIIWLCEANKCDVVLDVSLSIPTADGEVEHWCSEGVSQCLQVVALCPRLQHNQIYIRPFSVS